MIYVYGDTHGGHDSHTIFNAPFTDKDVLVILGDFGYLWDNSDNERTKLKRLIKRLPCTLAFLDGNHENHHLLAKLPREEKWGNSVGNYLGCYHLLRGNIYNIQNNKVLVIGGAASSDKLHRIVGKSWWPEELLSVGEINHTLDNKDLEVDFVLTHTAPENIIQRMNYRPNDPVSQFLTHIQEIATFKEWHFGHMHEDRQILDKYFCHYNGNPMPLIKGE